MWLASDQQTDGTLQGTCQESECQKFHRVDVMEHAQRILVAGASGAGKSTLAAGISAKLGIPYTEIDSLFHGPNWEPREDFLRDVAAIAEGETWVSEWQYVDALAILAGRATTMVWLDYRWPLQISRVIRRTVRRRLTRQELWNGNREGPLRTVFTDDEHVVRWAWQTRHNLRDLPERMTEEYPQLALVRLRSPRDARRWVSELD